MRRWSLILLLLLAASAFLVGLPLLPRAAARARSGPRAALARPGPRRSLAGLGASLVLQPIGERWLRPSRARLIAWPASLWMGFAFLLLLGLFASDVAALARGRRGGGGRRICPGPGAGAGLRAAAVLSLALLAGLAGLRSGLRAAAAAPRRARAAALAGGPRRLSHRADQRHPHRADPRDALSPRSSSRA